MCCLLGACAGGQGEWGSIVNVTCTALTAGPRPPGLHTDTPAQPTSPGLLPAVCSSYQFCPIAHVGCRFKSTFPSLFLPATAAFCQSTHNSTCIFPKCAAECAPHLAKFIPLHATVHHNLLDLQPLSFLLLPICHQRHAKPTVHCVFS